MGVAVVATSTEAALKGRDALKVQWDKGTHPDLDNQQIEQREAIAASLPCLNWSFGLVCFHNFLSARTETRRGCCLHSARTAAAPG